MMEELSRMFLAFLSKNATVTVVILAVLLARLFLRKMPKKYSYFLWAIVGIRMLFDLPFASKFSIFNLFRGLSGRTSTAERVLSSGQDVTDTIGISGISNVKNAANTAVTAGNTFHSSAAASSAALIMSQRILGIAGLIWLIGIIVFLAYGIFSYVKCRILVRTAVLANDVSRNDRQPWPLKQHSRRALKLTVWECDRIPSPFVLGIIRPRIYIPFRMGEQEQAYILAHEACHIRRLDSLWKFVAFLLLAVYWCNPLAWVAFLCMVRDMEMSCDEAVIEQFGNEIKQGYSNSLLAFAMERHPYSFAPVAFGEGDAGRRIKNVLNFKKPQTWVAIVVIVLLVIVGISCLTNRKDSNEPQNNTQQQNDSEITSTEVPTGTEADTEIENTTTETTEQSATSTNTKPDDPAFIFAKARLKKWAEAFCRRDVQTIASMTSDDAKADMKKEMILDDNSNFGWSSPWPQLSYQENKIPGWNIIDIDTRKNIASILYYAWTSDPHVTVWAETLEYTLKDDVFTITGEKLEQFDEIANAADFDKAYPKRTVSTPMDYRINGLGETLNDHAMSANGMSPDGQFDLTDPVQAATYLLNLSTDTNKAEVTTVPGTDSSFVTVNIHFTGENQDRSVVMRPYKTGGIWIVSDKVP